jgi:mono/diheme cytochrome c family protein
MRRLSTSYTAPFVFSLFVIMGVAAGAQAPGGNAEAKKLKNPVPSSPESIKAGQASFQKYCRFCHGADAKGNGPQAPEGSHPSDLTDAKWDRGDSDGEIFTVIKEGAGPKFVMKGFKSKMTDQEIWNVVNYMRTLQAK